MTKTDYKPPFCVGEWLPSDHQVLEIWLGNLIDHVDQNPKPFHPVITDFQNLIETDPEVFMLFHLMFTQVPDKPPYNKDPDGKPQVRDYMHMLKLFNEIMTRGSEYNDTELVGFPINAILNWPMATTAGFAAFQNDKVNAQLKNVLSAWGKFLDSKESLAVLIREPENDQSWLGNKALAKMSTAALGPDDPDGFAKIFQCDPNDKHFGFTSWDNFFTREFRDGQRPIADPDDNSIVTNACESAPFNMVQNVQRRDRFWIKGQPYSIQHMLDNDPLVDQFVGGTVYQAFLNAVSFHRWNCPVDGTILKVKHVDGTYYSETLVNSFAGGDPDIGGPNESQGYLAEMATRALIFIEADNEDIGLMCVMPIGMAEVSSCEVTVYEGQHVKKGDQLGMFHFGGSTHCLIFGPHVNIEFDFHGMTPGIDAPHNIPVNAKIAKVGPRKS
ncbi:MAG: phosphatidylserine decarboxylase family protein [Pseudomonadota bacterium]